MAVGGVELLRRPDILEIVVLKVGMAMDARLNGGCAVREFHHHQVGVLADERLDFVGRDGARDDRQPLLQFAQAQPSRCGSRDERRDAGRFGVWDAEACEALHDVAHAGVDVGRTFDADGHPLPSLDVVAELARQAVVSRVSLRSLRRHRQGDDHSATDHSRVEAA